MDVGVRAVLADRAGEPGERDRLLRIAVGEDPAERGREVRDDTLEQRVEGPRAQRRRPGVERLVARERPLQLPPGDRPQRLRAEPGLQRAAQVQHRRRQRQAVRRVARPQHVRRRREREQRDQVGRRPPRGVDEQVRMLRQHPPEPGEVGDRGVREDQPRARELAAEAHRVLAERRDPSPRVDQDRHAPLVRERHHLADGRLGQREPLRPRVQLDAARARVEAAPRLGGGTAVRVDAAERLAAGRPSRRRPRSRGRWRPGSRRAPASGTRRRARLRPPARRAAAPASACSRPGRRRRRACARRTGPARRRPRAGGPTRGAGSRRRRPFGTGPYRGRGTDGRY